MQRADDHPGPAEEALLFSPQRRWVEAKVGPFRLLPVPAHDRYDAPLSITIVQLDDL
jgi:hypothetical protein